MGRDGAGVESLYPFLYSGTSDLDDVLDQVRRSTVDKAAEIVELRRLTVRRDAARLADCARAIARSFTGGGRLFARRWPPPSCTPGPAAAPCPPSP